MNVCLAPDARPTTRAPRFFAIWTASDPTPPAAAEISTTSSFPAAASFRSRYAVRPWTISPAARSKSKPGGSLIAVFASTTACVAYPPPASIIAATPSPTEKPFTPVPMERTTPSHFKARSKWRTWNGWVHTQSRHDVGEVDARRLDFNQELTVGDNWICALEKMDLLGIAELCDLCICHDVAPYGASTPKMTIRLASTTPGQNGDFMPDAIATRRRPLARYVTTPPPVTCPRSHCQSTWPLR